MSFQLMAFLPWFEYLRKYTSERFKFVSISLINFSRPTCCMHSEHAQWVVFCVWCMESGSSLILLWVAQHSRGKCLLWSMGVWASFLVSLVEDLLVKTGQWSERHCGAWEDSSYLPPVQFIYLRKLGLGALQGFLLSCIFKLFLLL